MFHRTGHEITCYTFILEYKTFSTKLGVLQQFCSSVNQRELPVFLIAFLHPVNIPLTIHGRQQWVIYGVIYPAA